MGVCFWPSGATFKNTCGLDPYQIASDYRQRVLADGGTIHDSDFIDSLLFFLDQNHMLCELAAWHGPALGNKVVDGLVEKRYDIYGQDALPLDAALKASFGSDAAGKPYYSLPSGNRAYIGTFNAPISGISTLVWVGRDTHTSWHRAGFIGALKSDKLDVRQNLGIDITKYASSTADNIAIYRGDGTNALASGVTYGGAQATQWRTNELAAAISYSNTAFYTLTKMGMTQGPFSTYFTEQYQRYIVGSSGTANPVIGYMRDALYFRKNLETAQMEALLGFLNTYYNI